MGNSFIVNIKVGIQEKPILQLEDTVDYSILLKIIQNQFETPTPLLETLLEKIENDVQMQIQGLSYFYLSIQKLNPPLNSLVKSSEVILEKRY